LALTPPSPCLSDTGLTVVDTCNNLEWEKKDGANGTPGSGTPDPGNPHDVDNMYSWAGRCSLDTSVRCQPNVCLSHTSKTGSGGALFKGSSD
jgi:hypothetical protein